jgi:hypothetical protein
MPTYNTYYDVADADSVTLTATVVFYASTRLTSVTIGDSAHPAHPLSKFLSAVTYSHKPNGPCNENT